MFCLVQIIEKKSLCEKLSVQINWFFLGTHFLAVLKVRDHKENYCAIKTFVNSL